MGNALVPKKFWINGNLIFDIYVFSGSLFMDHAPFCQDIIVPAAALNFKVLGYDKFQYFFFPKLGPSLSQNKDNNKFHNFSTKPFCCNFPI